MPWLPTARWPTRSRPTPRAWWPARPRFRSVATSCRCTRRARRRAATILLVISEIWGVHEYVRDSTRRFAKEGYYAIAPELFKPEDVQRFAAMLKEHNKNVDIVMFPAGHGFHADYRQSWSATQAWKLCTDFFSKNLRA